MIINGKNIYISVRDAEGTWYPIACDSSCTISMSRPTLAVTGAGDGVWKKVIAGNRIEASVSGNGLINFNKQMSMLELQKKLIDGTPVWLMCEIPVGSEYVVYEAPGYVTSTELTGAYRAAGTFTYEIDINGALMIDSTVTKDPDQIGIQNLLAVDEDDLLDIGDNSNLII